MHALRESFCRRLQLCTLEDSAHEKPWQVTSVQTLMASPYSRGIVLALKSSSLYSSVGGHLNSFTNTHMVNGIEE